VSGEAGRGAGGAADLDAAGDDEAADGGVLFGGVQRRKHAPPEAPVHAVDRLAVDEHQGHAPLSRLEGDVGAERRQ